MGFIRANVLPILKEHKLSSFGGHCLCLGQADVYFTYENLQHMAKLTQVDLVPGVPITLSHRPDLAVKGYISHETLFKSIGFTQISALDYSDFEGAEFQFDLNSADLPLSLANRFDAVFDHGTIEHIFHIPNCFANIFALLKVGGRVIHSSPSSNYIDHGFYMFSPTLFFDFYSANDWEISTIQVGRVTPQLQEIEAPYFADYEPGIFDHLSAGGLDGKAYVTICIAGKKPTSSGRLIPSQGYYSRYAGWRENVKPKDLKTIQLFPPFQQERENCWVVDLGKYVIADGDSMAEPANSLLMLMENQVRLGPAHTLHETIRKYGKGCFSHWQNMLYFSTSDNSNPNLNGRTYQMLVPK